jgi:chorismate synthase
MAVARARRGRYHTAAGTTMSFNTFGHLFRVTTFGESHGPAVGCVVDGCPPAIALAEADIQPYLDKRRPGQSRFTSQRREPDVVRILSGVVRNEAAGAQVTTGTPIALLIENVDQRAKDYSDIADKYRPGHADYTYDVKYGIRDHRGGGRQSARETATRVAAGAIARKIVPGMLVRGALIQIGEHRIDRARWSWEEIERNPLFCPDAEKAKFLEAYLDDVRRRGSSVGAVIEVVAEGVPPGLGAPIYGKLDGDLAAALMGINAVKGVEIGAGFAAAALSGEENADEMRMGNDGKPVFLSNHAGGILGGISTGQPVVCRFAVKPTSSIPTPRRTVDRYGAETEISTKGRHDPCVGIRAVPVGEAMVACVIADHYLRQRGQVGEAPAWPLVRSAGKGPRW